MAKENNSNDIIRGRDFEESEVQEINKYILTNVPYSVLEQIFPLTENVINKITVFTTVYRLINSSLGYVSEEKTKNKLKKLIQQVSGVHNEVYKDLIVYQAGELGSGNKFDNLVEVLRNPKKNELINNLIDIFLVFAERQKLYDLNKITGIKTDVVEGEQLVNELTEIND